MAFLVDNIVPITLRIEDVLVFGNNVPSVIPRYFTTFDPVLQTYMTMQTPITIDGTKPTSWLFATTSTTTMLILGSGISPERFYVGFEGGKLLVGNGVNRVIDTLPVNDGKLHTLTWFTSGGVFRVDIDGVTRYSAPMSATLPKSFNNYGRENNGSFYFDGVLANLVVGGESWKLDRPIGTNTEQSSSGNNLLTYVNATKRELFTKVGNDWLGGNFWDYNLVAAGSGTVATITDKSVWDITVGFDNPSGVFNGGRLVSIPSLIVGQTYRYQCVNSRAINLGILDSAFTRKETVIDGSLIQFTSTATTRLYVSPRLTGVTNVSSPSLKRILEVA